MKKVIVGLSVALLVLGAMGCSKEKKVKSAAASTGASEQILSIEVKAQLNDPAATDPNTALSCKYVLVSNNNKSVGEAKTSGSCKWNEITPASAGALNAAAAAKVISIISADTSLPANVKEKWDCKAINIKTTVRQVGAQDCKDGSGVGDATAKALSAALGL